MNKASARSRKKLEGVDNRLVLLLGYALAISPMDFFVNEGVRSEKKQKEFYKLGRSKCDGVINRSKRQDGKAIMYIMWGGRVVIVQRMRDGIC